MPHNSPDPLHFHSDAELAALVRQFEDCTLAPVAFTHGAHLAVALWYLAHAPFDAAAAQMRQGLLRFITHNQVPPEKYNETITLFWLKLVRHFLDCAAAERPLSDLANELLTRFGDTKLLFTHYSREVIESPAAKAQWLAPDLRPLNF